MQTSQMLVNEQIRHVEIAYALFKLNINGVDVVLVNYNHKWGDWNFVGGHVEPPDCVPVYPLRWFVAARRGAAEEMVPLRIGHDFYVSSDLLVACDFGPTPSRSNGALTVYHTRWFVGTFFEDPVGCLARLNPQEFRLIPVAKIESTLKVSTVVAQAEKTIPGGWAAVRTAWVDSIGFSGLGLDDSTKN